MEREFGARSSADDVLDGVDVEGRHFVVTGATGGLGAETVRALAVAGADVIATGRDREKGEGVLSRVRSERADAKLRFVDLELADLASVRACAADLRESLDAIDVLIDNAAVMACPFSHSADGYELQLATNHFGHFALTLELLPLLRRGSAPRVVVVSSGAHWMGAVDLDDLQFEQREYDPWAAYGQSKTANALFALELQRRFGAELTAYSLHPGAIPTELGRNVEAGREVELPPEVMKTIPQGAATQVWAATASELEGFGGRYLEDCAVAEERDLPDTAGTALGVAPHARDPEVAAALWEASVRLIEPSSVG